MTRKFESQLAEQTYLPPSAAKVNLTVHMKEMFGSITCVCIYIYVCINCCKSYITNLLCFIATCFHEIGA